VTAQNATDSRFVDAAYVCQVAVAPTFIFSDLNKGSA
jgi:hypothetical protein